MRKFSALVLALTLVSGGISFADVQIDRGQTRGQTGAVSKFFIARNGRGGTVISADRVVVWDAISDDGVSVTTSTTSYDALAAGVTIDQIPGITSDATAANSPGGTNWGRVRVYGRHAAVSWDSNVVRCVAGARVGVSTVAGEATIYKAPSQDNNVPGQERYDSSSKDSFGVTLQACAAGNKTIDVFVQRG